MSEASSTISHDGGHHAHDPHLAHHFDTPAQQFGSAKLGMWVFLGTEILMFGGLFCAYGVFRYSHPDVFVFAHQALNPVLGGINTAVLIASSLTMAMAVRYAQLGKHTALSICLALTILGGVGFLGIKFVEYKAKWEHHLFPGRYNVYNNAYKGDHQPPEDLAAAATGEHGHGEADDHGAPPTTHASDTGPAGSEDPLEQINALAAAHPSPYADPLAGTPDEPKIKPIFHSPQGISEQQQAERDKHHLLRSELSALDQSRINTFFSVYFCMTGLHGVHVIIGMGLITWVLIRALKREFGPRYFTPVDLVGLYWHLVDLIWIFLFPLLYLIH